MITHTDPISVPGWSGAGYVVFDPVKGDGAWRIGGGANGGSLAFAHGAAVGVAAASLTWLAILGGPIGMAFFAVALLPLLFGGLWGYLLFSLDGGGNSSCWKAGFQTGYVIAALINVIGNAIISLSNPSLQKAFYAVIAEGVYGYVSGAVDSVRDCT